MTAAEVQEHMQPAEKVSEELTATAGVAAAAARAAVTISEEEVAEATAGDSSPIGAGLLYLRRMRAHRAQAGATASAVLEEAPTLKLTDEPPAFDGLGVPQAQLDTFCIVHRLGAAEAQSRGGEPSVGLSQGADADEQVPGEPEEALFQVKRTRAFQGEAAAERVSGELWAQAIAAGAGAENGLPQAELDKAGVAFSAASEEPESPASGPEEQLFRIKRQRAFAAAAPPQPLSQAELDAMCIDGGDEDASPAGVEASLHELKRLYAFGTREQAAAFQAQAFPKAAEAAQAATDGLSQAELDALIVADGAELDAEPADGPEELCFRRRRARAFGGLELEAAEAEGEGEGEAAAEALPLPPKVTVHYAEPVPQKSLTLPISKSGASPRLLGRPRSLSASKDPNDKEEQAMTPSRGRCKSAMLAPGGKSPAAGLLSPSFARSPRTRGGA